MKEDHIPWQWLLLGILDDHHNRATLQEIYSSIEEQHDSFKNENTELINPRLFTVDERYGNRPIFQHTVRACLSSYKKRGWIIQTDGATYQLTDTGKQRLGWIQANA